MKINETTYTVNKHGGLRIPAAAMKEMGLQAGDRVRVAYLTSDGIRNEYREFLITYESVAGESEEMPQISIPVALMEQAKIPEEADLRVVCLDGFLIIMQEPALGISEMAAVLTALDEAESIVSQIPADMDICQIREQLRAAIDDAQEGREAG